MTSSWAPPLIVGCVRCGAESPADRAVYAQCGACGKVCGLCLSCARIMNGSRPFLRDAMDWHRERRHPDLALPPAEHQPPTWRGRALQWGERVVL